MLYILFKFLKLMFGIKGSRTNRMIPGKQGPRGHKGDQGAQGLPGDAGRQGVKGAPGESCDRSHVTELETNLKLTAERCMRVETLLEELKKENAEMAQKLKELSGKIFVNYF